MRTIQLQVDDSSIIDKNSKADLVKRDIQKKLDQAKDILKNKISNPMQYQRILRDEWDRT